MRVVHTRKNTTFAVWRQMTAEALAQEGINIDDVPKLRIQHAYEFDEVPQFWAKNYADKLRAQANTAMVNRMNG